MIGRIAMNILFMGKSDLNQKKFRAFAIWMILAMTVGGFAVQAQTTATLTVQANQPGALISSNLFGIFFEEINHAGDGGIYAEMVSNRNFEAPGLTAGWQFVPTGSAVGTLSADSSMPLSASNVYAAKLSFSSGSGTAGLANNGYWGMNFQAGQTYNLGLYARCSSGFTGAINASLQSANGSQVYAQGLISGLTTNWQYFSRSLVPNSSDTAGRLALVISQPGSVWVDVVSLFPQQTFDNRPNGMRPDLMNKLVNLQPSFMRFPGGSWVNGNSLTNMYAWKRTIGPLGDRRYQNNLWGYYVDNGQGYYEYLQMCEDLGTEPLFVINCGMDVFSVGDSVPLASMGPYVQDALDAIQYANGPANSTWGALRAAAGHPAPFNLKYIEIGNENGGSAYNDRYALFYDAIKTNYPDMHIIADNWGGLPVSRPVEISDEHYYSDPTFFMANATKYDSYSRSGPKVYVGEYAVTTGAGNGNLIGALGEAAFMTGLERNADIVCMASYAPLFANLNSKNWNPDLIYFTSSQVYGTPSYYVQQMFSVNRGDEVLPLTLNFTGDTNAPPHGAIGLGSWNTSVQYTNIVITSNGVTLYQSDFVNSGTNGWRVYNGNWAVNGGIYQQTTITTDCRSTTGNTNWANYTITLRARKVGGSEGFLILFNWLDDNNWTWFNVGGWNNTQTAIEQMVNGSKSIIGQGVPGSVQTLQWYDIRLVLNGTHIQGYVNNVLVLDVSYPAIEPVYASASYAAASGRVILKAVNVTGNPIVTTFNLNGLPSVSPQASLSQLASANSLAENSLANPTNVFPVNGVISNAATNFSYTLPAYSLSVIRFQTPPISPVRVGLGAGTNVNYLDPLSGGVPVNLSSFITNDVSVDFTVEAADGAVVTNGTLQFVPGQTNLIISLPPGVLQPGAFFRVTLTNPVNGQLDTVPRAFFAVASSGGPLQLGVARYADENLVYWTATNATLLEATNLAGPWTTNNNQSAPIQVPESPTSEFFRLMQ